MKRLAALAVLTWFVLPVAVATAKPTARSLNDARVGRTEAELRAQVSYSTAVVNAMRGSWRVAPRHATCWSNVPWSEVCDRARRRLLAQRWLLGVAQRRLDQLHPRVDRVTLAALTCIHRYEGAWNDETGNGFHGGLQMDSTFQHQYGPDFEARWGSAGNWPAWSQIVAASRAVHGWPQAPDHRARTARGYAPWPNTARTCGLL